MLPADLLRAKRDGHALSDAQVEAFVRGVVDGSWADAQVGAMAMAICLRGMDRREAVALTRAMTASGEVLDWRAIDGPPLPGPILDKHSTGGVGDKVSLVLAPLVAVCGGIVPMVSGRGLGHTGGTLDKLEALPGYTSTPTRERLLAVLREAGCAIVGASERLAPADRRLYAIRDVTATVESVALITGSILSKKLAAGLEALVLDVKVGNGAFCTTPEQAHTLAHSLVEVAAGAGLRCAARLTDMDQVLGTTAGNALEVGEALALLRGEPAEPRLLEVTLALAAPLLVLGGLAADEAVARAALQRALDSGAAAERWARMVAALGGPRDVFAHDGLPAAPLQCDVPAPRDGVLAGMDTRAIGQAIVALGGGRTRPGDAVDPRVGLSALRPLGTRLRAGDAVARLHAADATGAQAAIAALQAALRIADEAPAPTPVVRGSIG